MIYFGNNGQIELDEHHVIIRRKGLLGFATQGLKGEKRIPFSSITAVQFKDSGTFTAGYIQFSIFGGVESRAGLMAATQDENTVMFNRGQRDAFADLRTLVESKTREAREPRHSAPASVADELNKLADLRDRGILTEDEFAGQKASLLRR